ncbi:MAG: DUF4256 domain-containing protein [Gemmatimonadaceae bacterium]
MPAKKSDDLLTVLKERFEKHMPRHVGVAWKDVQSRLEASASALKSLRAMEESGGEPDVIARDKKSGAVTFCDCSPESPSQRRSLCYDGAALRARKENKPKSSAAEMAASMGVELISEEQYHALQALGQFDLKTSSWLGTPAEVRSLGGALFGDRRFGRVFVYHNGAESYYAARGWRGILKV